MKRVPCIPLLALLLVSLGASSLGCQRKSKESLGLGPEIATEQKMAVCLSDGLPVRPTVGKGGKVVSSLSLGEVVKLTGDSEKDPAGKEYFRIELSDGNSGWVANYGIVASAQVAAVKEDSPLFKRPDILTATPQKVPFMSIVAVTQEKMDWLQVMGEGKKELGWLQKKSLTFVKEDITAAVMATKKLREKDGLEPAAKLEEILRSTPFPNSFFIQKLKEKAVEMAQPAATPAPGVTWSPEGAKEPQ